MSVAKAREKKNEKRYSIILIKILVEYILQILSNKNISVNKTRVWWI